MPDEKPEEELVKELADGPAVEKHGGVAAADQSKAPVPGSPT